MWKEAESKESPKLMCGTKRHIGTVYDGATRSGSSRFSLIFSTSGRIQTDRCPGGSTKKLAYPNAKASNEISAARSADITVHRCVATNVSLWDLFGFQPCDLPSFVLSAMVS